jgi:hypothetical protein
MMMTPMHNSFNNSEERNIEEDVQISIVDREKTLVVPAEKVYHFPSRTSCLNGLLRFTLSKLHQPVTDSPCLSDEILLIIALSALSPLDIPAGDW